MNLTRIVFVLISFAFLSACAEAELASHFAKQVPPVKQPQQTGLFKIGNPYEVAGRTYRPREQYDLVETGIASWYGPDFNGKRTANGEIFDENELTAAHRTLQLPSLVRVTNLENGRTLIVRVNDRGPFSKGRVIDVSKRAADLLGFKNKGTAKVKLEVLSEESLRIAELAKQGKSTAGTEIAMNERFRTSPAAYQHDEEEKPSLTYVSGAAQNGLEPSAGAAEPITTVELEPLTPVPGHIKRGTFYPDPVVDTVPVHPTSIYVQTGSFTNPENASRLAQGLRSFGDPQIQTAQVQGRTFYRVRIRAPSVPEADTLLARLNSAGNTNALIVVE